MLRKLVLSAALAAMVAVPGYSQGLTTNATTSDWEEINFEFGSAVLSDGYPSLLRLAQLLKDHPAYRVMVEGNTDNLGSARSNERLGLARANAVRDFLIKYGAAPNQIQATTRGKNNPKYPGAKNTYSRTDVARWMNRRVVLTVTNEQGNTVSDGGAAEAIHAITQAPPAPPPPQPNCCQDILQRLNKLDDIARMLQQLIDQNNALRRDVDNLKQQQAALEAKVNGAPKPLTEAQTTAVVQKQVEAARQPRFSLLGANVGTDDVGNVTFTGKGRFFAPFAEHFAFQSEAEYLYFKTQREGQFDFGLVDRLGNFQAGLFSSFKHVNLSGAQNGGTLGQGAFTLDYLFNRGRVGLFGTKGFLNNPIIDQRNATFATGQLDLNGNPIIATAPNIFVQRYLSIIDQAGVSTTLGLWGKNYLEANLGYLRSVGNADRPGGTVRLIFPIGSKLAFTAEGGVNETLLGPGNDGRAVFGVQWGNFLRPKEYLGQKNPVPADIPRVRYEVLSRRIHIGTSPPVADAGPNQIGVPAGGITLNGSRSYDPNGEPLTFEWLQVTGPSVSLSGANTAIATFNASAGQAYAFRLTVRNTDNQMASAMVTVTTVAQRKVAIQFFIADPTTIQGGQSTTLQWKITNADSATITPGPGSVSAQGGSLVVTPASTTTYTLTAKNSIGQAVANVTVVVQNPVPKILVCTAVPMTINPGESATLYFNTVNATSVSISPGVGSVGVNGNVVVSPTTNTTYTIMATNTVGSDTCSVGVQVTAGTAPRIVRFSADPLSVVSGSTSTLVWQVENATTVSISPGIGTVDLVGTRDVTPTQATTYTLTATNSFGTVTATASVTVTAPPPPPNPVITSFTASPPSSSTPGSPVVLTCLAQNATSVSITGVGAVNASGSVTVNPQTTTAYQCVATNSTGGQASQSLTVPVTSSSGGGTGPVIVVSGADCAGTVVGGSVVGNETCQTLQRTFDLNLSSSTSPLGNTPLSFVTTSRNGQAAVIGAASATPTIQLPDTKGDYLFDVMVTDSKGNQTKLVIDVLYL
jgi:OmpA family/K319L-like, PKD domain